MNGFLPDPADVALLGVDRARLTRRLLAGTILWSAGAVSAAVLLVMFTTAPPAPLTVACLVVGCAAWVSQVRSFAHRAGRRRNDMDIAVAVFLDLVNVLLAGGAGVETSMLAAASAGDGWAFDQIRLALARAQSSRRSYWDALAELGGELGVESLVDVSHSVQLAGEHGARVRQSLASKAHALRARNLARIEHQAEERTEQMGLPLVVLFVGFVVLVGYPAFATTLAGL